MIPERLPASVGGDRPAPVVLCARLADTLAAALAPLAAGRSHYGLLDYPAYWNIGDSAIWAGEIPLLGHLHGRPAAYTSQMRYPPAEPGRLLPRDAVLYLQGGGNFGDIWPRHQLYREAVIARHPHHRIVQLPQSIHYDDPAAVERTRRVIGAHGDFHLMVRDAESAAFAQRMFDCPVILAPDAAFAMDMADCPRATAPQGILALLRADKERRADAAEGRALLAAAGARIVDWGGPGKLRRRAEKAFVGLGLVLPFRAAQGLRRAGFDAMAAARVAWGFARIDAAAVLVTDRLHGHILASLLGKPHVVIDNSYGKIGRFIDAWGQDGATWRARDYAEAAEIALALQAEAER